MRLWPGLVTAACCAASAAGVVYLHGFERALGHEDWRHRPDLIKAYSGEVVFRASPCVVLAAAALLSVWSGVWPLSAAAVAIAGAVLPPARTSRSGST